MKFRKESNNFRKRISYLKKAGFAFGLLITILSTATHSNSDKVPEGVELPTAFPQHLNSNSNRKQLYIIHLPSPSVSELFSQYREKNLDTPSPQLQQFWLKKIHAEQEKFISTLPSANMVKSKLTKSINAIKIELTSEDIPNLQLDATQTPISRVTAHTLNLSKSVNWVGGDAIKKSGLTGKGLRIGVIDSGVDYHHKALGGSGSGFESNNPELIEPGSFPNDVVVGGIDLAGDYKGDAFHPDNDPLDLNGHGTHVASIIAGRAIEGEQGSASGMVPEASIYAIKVFSPQGAPSYILEEAIEWSLDPNQDGDISDHLDVINLSLGSSYGRASSSDAIVLENITRLGVISVVAAGNDSAEPYIIASPAVTPSAISVAASHSGNQLFVPATLTTKNDNTPIRLHLISQVDRHPTDLNAQVTFDSDTDCIVPPDTNGKIILLASYKDNFCDPSDYAYKLHQAGALALVIESRASLSYTLLFGSVDKSFPMYVTDLRLSSHLTDNSNELQISNSQVYTGDPVHRIAPFSSAGPYHGLFKPEISAPGVNVRASAGGTGSLDISYSGTSMATPIVAGAMAALKQSKPTLSVLELKALAMNYALPIKKKNGDYYPMSSQGIGELSIEGSVNGAAIAFPAGLNFGYADLENHYSNTQTITIKNLDNSAVHYKTSLIFGQKIPGVHISAPEGVWLGPLEEKKLDIMVHMNPYEMQGLPHSDAYEYNAWLQFESAERIPFRIAIQVVLRPASNIEFRHGPEHSIKAYNESQITATVSAFPKVNAYRIRTNKDAPQSSFGSYYFRDNSGNIIFRLASHAGTSWKSSNPIYNQTWIRNIFTQEYEYALTVTDLGVFTTGRASGIFKSIVTNSYGDILSIRDAYLDQDSQSWVGEFELPKGAFETAHPYLLNFTSSVESFTFERYLLFPPKIVQTEELPFQEKVLPYNANKSPVINDKPMMWIVPEQSSNKEALYSAP